ncbi:Uncharacterised protein [uncultured archaeon]|nr:Uncharacterised protein [uncultured archaeon]
MDIKIVGTVTDENGLDEIESIMQIFAYEQRMKDYTSHVHTNHLAKEVKMIDKKTGENNKYIPRAQPRILVKGLC